ncbi:hypothetical protein KKF45_04470, partial [Patescibacteria group bacterium]|nr:hypothetical protein [Patescibacteria group bacterium]
MEQYQRDEDFVPVVYSEDEKAFLTKIKSEMENARNVRDEAHVEFDDMSYLKFYEFNAKAGNGYIAPKANKEDVRTTTGTTLEKKNTLMSNILNLNLDPAINAYEKSNIHVTEIGDTMASMVKKSWNMERPIFDVKEVQILDELLTQGTVFVKDELISFKLPVKTVKSMDFSDMKKIEWNESMGKVTEMMNTRLLSGPNVYLGNFSEPYMQLQPYVVVRTVLSRSEARAIYGDWDRWKNVPHKFESDNDDKAYNNWTLEAYHDDYVEVLEYMTKWDNNYMVLLNGTMMFPVKFQDR